MIKQTAALIFGLTFIFNQATGQTFKQQFKDLVSKKDTLGQTQLLEKWEKDGLAIVTNGRLILSFAGRMLGDEIAQKLI